MIYDWKATRSVWVKKLNLYKGSWNLLALVAEELCVSNKNKWVQKVFTGLVFLVQTVPLVSTCTLLIMMPLTRARHPVIKAKPRVMMKGIKSKKYPLLETYGIIKCALSKYQQVKIENFPSGTNETTLERSIH